MAQFVLEAQRVLLDELDLTRFTHTVGFNDDVDPVDVTCLGQSTKSNIAGLYGAGLNLEGYTSIAHTDALFAKLASDVMVSFFNSTTEGDLAYFQKALLNAYSPFGDTVGDASKYSAQCASQNPLIRGLVMAYKTVNATGNGTVFQLPAVAAGQKLYGALHVISASGTSPTLDVLLKSDATNAFSGSETTRLTFTQATATGVQYLTADGPITNTYYRASHTVGGSTPVLGYVLLAGVR